MDLATDDKSMIILQSVLRRTVSGANKMGHAKNAKLVTI